MQNLINTFLRNGNTISIFEITENGQTSYMIESNGYNDGRYFLLYEIDNYFTALRLAVKKLQDFNNPLTEH